MADQIPQAALSLMIDSGTLELVDITQPDESILTVLAVKKTGGVFDVAGAASAVQENLDTHTGLSTTAHGGIVASTDPRLTNARAPTAHAATHGAGGSDAISHKVLLKGNGSDSYSNYVVALASGTTTVLFAGLPDCVVQDPNQNAYIPSIPSDDIHNVVAGTVYCISIDNDFQWQTVNFIIDNRRYVQQPYFTMHDGHLAGFDGPTGRLKDLGAPGTAAFQPSTAFDASGAAASAASASVPLTQKGAANGVATLDVNSQIPTSQLPAGVFEFKGQWNPTTNIPALADGTGTSGFDYEASVAGSHDFGHGSIQFDALDHVAYNGAIWERRPGSDLNLTVAKTYADGVGAAAQAACPAETAQSIGTLVAGATAIVSSYSGDIIPVVRVQSGNIITGLSFSNLFSVLNSVLNFAGNSASAIRSLLGITTLSGSNTGDQTLPVKASGSEIISGTEDAKFATPKAIADAGLAKPITWYDATFASGSSSYTVTDARVLATSLIEVWTLATVGTQKGQWYVVASAGSFLVSSYTPGTSTLVSETSNIAFKWALRN